MKKLLMLGALGMITVVGAEGVKFSKVYWDGIRKSAEEQAAKEFEKEFVVCADLWESGKGVSYITTGDGGTAWMQFNSDGRLVKVGKDDSDFPEVVKLNKRTSELERQMREEYAKSLGVTIRDIIKVTRQTHLDPDRMEKLRDAMAKGAVRQREKRSAEDDKLDAQLKKIREERQTSNSKTEVQ